MAKRERLETVAFIHQSSKLWVDWSAKAVQFVTPRENRIIQKIRPTNQPNKFTIVANDGWTSIVPASYELVIVDKR